MPTGTFTCRGASLDTGGDKSPYTDPSSTPGGGFPKPVMTRATSSLARLKSRDNQTGEKWARPALQHWPGPQVLAASLFTSSSWTSFQTCKKKTNRNRHTNTPAGIEEHQPGFWAERG